MHFNKMMWIIVMSPHLDGNELMLVPGLETGGRRKGFQKIVRNLFSVVSAFSFFKNTVFK